MDIRSIRKSRWIVLLLLLGVIGAVTGVAVMLGPAALAQPGTSPPRYDATFWQHWNDGRAELAGYRLTFPRYGEARQGSAVAIFVKESFSNETRVKVNPADHPDSDTFPVMKLNLIQDFSTGIYDYNMMTSAFVALESVNGYPAGSPTKVAFSSQEWCGLVHAQYLFDDDGVDYTLHSYFEGEADQRTQLDTRQQPLVEDALLLWARGIAGPRLEPGEQREDVMLRGLQYSRLHHASPSWTPVTLSRSAQTEQVEVPAGDFTVERLTAEVDGGRTWTFYVEDASPHRIIKWTTSDGQVAEMTGVTRTQYWQMNSNRFREAVQELGLEVRDPGSM